MKQSRISVGRGAFTPPREIVELSRNKQNVLRQLLHFYRKRTLISPECSVFTSPSPVRMTRLPSSSMSMAVAG